ncbi:hypothetical protein UK12_14280 [Saccharothrix sp. ST-888]|nr:hypothetical protein UK12_14280 [Saccharothrix sp. ST-888]
MGTAVAGSGDGSSDQGDRSDDSRDSGARSAGKPYQENPADLGGAPSTRSRLTPCGSTVDMRDGTVVTPKPPATSCSFVSQSLVVWTMRGRPGRPGQTPSRGSALDDGAAVQGASTSSSTCTAVRPANRPVVAAPTSSSVSSTVSMCSWGDSPSDGRCGGREVSTATSIEPARRARISTGVVPSHVVTVRCRLTVASRVSTGGRIRARMTSVLLTSPQAGNQGGQQMRAAVLTEFGAPLTAQEMPDPVAGGGEVVVQVLAACVPRMPRKSSAVGGTTRSNRR